MGHVAVRHGADLFAAVEVLVANAALKPLARHVSSYQIARSTTYGLLLEGRQVGLLGFWPLGDGVEELYFACKPIAELGAAFLPLQRAGRLTIHQRLHHRSVRRIEAFVHHAHGPGQRLARLAGFHPSASADPPGAGFQLWVIER